MTLVPGTNDLGKLQKAIFTPDGQTIIFEGEELEVINIDGSGKRAIFPFPTENYQEIALSPNGTMLAFTERISIHEPSDDDDIEYDEYIASVFVCNLEGTGLRKLSEGFSGARTPIFSPHGTRTALLGSSENIGGVLTMRLDGTDVRHIENPQLQLELNPMSWAWVQ